MELDWKFTIRSGSGREPLQERYPSPSAAIIDSQSVKTAAMVHKAVGYDAGEKIKGCKRFMTVDTGRVSFAGLGNSSVS